MSITPHPSALKDWHTVKPSSFAAFLLMCEVHDSREPDVWLDEEKAHEYGIERTAFYFAFQQLQQEKWIEFSRKDDGKKRWRIIKGITEKSANADETGKKSANADNMDGKSANADIMPETEQDLSANADTKAEKSANADFLEGENPQTRTEKSANADSPLKDEVLKEESSQDSEESFERGSRAPALVFPPEIAGDFLAMHKIIYPDVELDSFQKQMIKNRIRDGTVWGKTLYFWRGNGNLGTSISRICDKYDELLLKEEKENAANGKDSKPKQPASAGGDSGKRSGGANDAHLKPRGIDDR